MSLSIWKYYAGFYRGSYLKLALTMILSIGQSLLVIPTVLIVKYLFDTIIPSGIFIDLFLFGAVLLLLNLVNILITLYTRHLTLRTTKQAVSEIRTELLNKCYLLPRSWFAGSDINRLHASIVQDTFRIDVMSNALVAQIFPSLLIIFGLCGILIYLNFFLFLIMILIVPLLYFGSQILKKYQSTRVTAYHRSFERFSKGILHILQKMDLTRVQSAESIEIQKQKERINDVRYTGYAMAWMNSAYSMVQNGIVAVSGILILVVGGIAIAGGTMTVGSLLSFYIAAVILNSNLQTIFRTFPQVIEGNESLTTLFQLLTLHEKLPYSGSHRVSFQGGISFTSVTFSYGNKPVLENINFSIPAGAMVALTGANGLGKSTIAHLALGLYKPSRGVVYADGVPYGELDLADLRKQIGVIMQDPIIFSGTIVENITYGFPEATQEEITVACQLANADGFIGELPAGLETPIGENGMLLSGGQRQRIVIARALLRNPKLFVLDEPTNHLDRPTVFQLINNLKTLYGKPAILLITQDMKIAEEAQIIYTLNEQGLSEHEKH